jgi:hypothetical protein
MLTYLQRILLLSILVFQVEANAAPVYKWVGREGIVHYSTVPPIDVPSVLLASPALRASEFKAAEVTSEPKLKGKDPVLETATKEAFQNCENAKDAIRALDAKAPVAKLSDKGTAVTLNSAGRQAERTKAVVAVGYWCEAPK